MNNEIIRKDKKRFLKRKGGEDVLNVESFEVVLVHCNLVNNNYEQVYKVLFFFCNKKTIWTVNYHCT